MPPKDLSLKIMIVDDNVHDHTFIKSSVSEFRNIRFSSAYSGDELIDVLLRRRSHGNSKDPLPDLILLDINMPGMSGFEVIDYMAKHSDFDMSRFVILSTSIEFDLNNCSKYDVMAYNKPDSWNQYGKLLRRIIDDFISVKKQPSVKGKG